MRSTPKPRGFASRAFRTASRTASRTLALLGAALLGVLLGLVTLVSLVTVAPRRALAAGTVTLGSREPVEEDGKWKLKMSIDYGRIPQLPHVPMIFNFTPTVLYERALTNKSPEKPVINRMPL